MKDMKLKCQRDLFTLDDDLIFLNGAYMSPLLKSVEEIGTKNMLIKRNPGKIPADDFFVHPENLKSVFAELINTDDKDGIVPVGSVSYGLANVAANIPFEKGDEIVLLHEQFPSNFYVWKKYADQLGLKIVFAEPQNEMNRGQSWNEDLLSKINKKTKVVSAAHVHWADGTLFDLEQVRSRCDEVGAYLIIDGTQSIGALAFDQSKIRADAIVCAGYKWLQGPYSIGVGYYGPKFSNGIPIEESWINRYKSNEFQNLVNYQPRYRDGAQRYAVGESSNFILLSMLVRSIEQTVEWGPNRFQEYCSGITHYIQEELKPYGFWIENKDYRGEHLFGVKIPKKLDMEKVKIALSNKNISVSYRGEYIRVSPSIYNTMQEADVFVKCLTELIK